METLLRNKIIFLASNNLLTAYKIGKGSGISVTTISQILDKKNNKNFKKSTLLRVLKYLEEKNNQSPKTREDISLVSKEVLDRMLIISEEIKQTKNKVEKIEILDRKIDYLFEFIKAGSDQLTMSLVNIEETKQIVMKQIKDQTEYFDEQIKGLNSKNRSKNF